MLMLILIMTLVRVSVVLRFVAYAGNVSVSS